MPRAAPQGAHADRTNGGGDLTPGPTNKTIARTEQVRNQHGERGADSDHGATHNQDSTKKGSD